MANYGGLVMKKRESMLVSEDRIGGGVNMSSVHVANKVTTSLDEDDCIQAELALAECEGGQHLERAPAELFRHLAECSLCFQTALSCMTGPGETEQLWQRVRYTKAWQGNEV